MKRTKQFLATLLTLLMLVSVVPLGIIISSAAYDNKDTSYNYPLRTISTTGRGFTSSHGGIDLSIAKGTPVYSSKKGTVKIVYSGCKNYNGAGNGKDCKALGCTSKQIYMNGKGYKAGYYCNNGFGNGVVIQNDDGKYCYYAHLNSVCVKVGDNVTPSTKIGEVGSSGCSTGAHLHFSVSNKASGGTNYDPFKYIFPGFSIKISNNGSSSTNPKLQINFAWKDFEAKKCTISFGTSSSSLTKTASDSNFTSPYCFYNLGSKFGNLTKGKTYYFKVRINKNGTTYDSSVYSFVAGSGDKALLDYSTVSSSQPLPNSYTFSFNGNGGSGSMDKMTVVKNQDFKLPANKFAKKGSVFQGWNVKRDSDGKYFVSEKGWLSPSEITSKKVSKKLYTNQGSYTFSASWQNGTKANDSFTFYAVWKECSGHKWDGGKVTKAATTTATGVKTYTCTLCGQTKTETIPKTAVTNPTVTLRSPSHIEKNAATVHLTAKNPSKLLITARGVQVKKKGESSWAKTYSEDLSKKTYNKDTEITGYFDIGSGKEVDYALSAGTTYEYRCFVTSGGTNYYSSTSTFSTLPPDADPTFSKVYASDITDTNATINAEFGSLTSIKSTGFYFGTNKDSLKKITKNLKGKADSAGKVKIIYFGLNDWYGKLTPGTTYYYKIFYVNNSGKACASNVYSFITTGNSVTYNFTIKFDANGGTGSMASMTVAKDKDFSLPNNQFSKAGYSFGGWTVKRSSDNKWYVPDKGWNTEKEIKEKGLEKKVYSSNTEYRFNNGWVNGTRTSDTYTFYAVWKECEHVWDSGVVTKEPTTKATGVMTYTCEKCGKTKTEKIPVISAYQMKFNANGGKGTMASFLAEEDEAFLLPENQFTKVGYTFGGWTVKRGSDSKWYTTDGDWNTAKVIKADELEKEIFESETEYTFTEDWINGSKTSDTYTFYAVWVACEHEWDEGEVTKEPTTSATGVMTYTCEICGKTKTAKIPKISTYSIKFNANGGKGTVAGMKVEKDGSFTLPENGFTKDGYLFIGWSVKRASDSKWLVEDDGWQTAKEIKANSYEKILFEEDSDLALDEDWINGSKETDTYTFYAMWEKDV